MPDAQQHRTRDLGILSLSVIAPIWGYSWVVSKVALDYARPFTFLALITSSCTGCLFVLLLATRRSRRPPRRGHRRRGDVPPTGHRLTRTKRQGPAVPPEAHRALPPRR